MALKPQEKVGNPRVVYGPRFGKSAIEQTFRNPRNGQTFDFVYFDYKNGSCFALIFPLTQNNEVIAVRQYRHGADSIVVEIPGGHPKDGQTAESTALGELLEETGYSPTRVTQVTPKHLWAEPASFTPRFHIFLATGCRKVAEQDLDETEDAEVFFTPLKKWLEMVLAGEVTDPKTIAATLLVLPYLGAAISLS